MNSTTNPYRAPHSDSAPLLPWHVRLLRGCWLTAAILCMVLAAREFYAGYQLRQRIVASGRDLNRVPPTMLTEHPAAGVVLVSVGLIFVLYGLGQARTAKGGKEVSAEEVA